MAPCQLSRRLRALLPNMPCLRSAWAEAGGVSRPTLARCQLTGTLLPDGFRKSYCRAAKILMADSWTARTKVQHNDVKTPRAFFLEHVDVPLRQPALPCCC